MSQYVIEVDDKVITEKVGEILNSVLNRQMNYKYTDTDYVIRDAVKELVYSRKDEIIDRVVERAVKEIVKKGLPKLLEKFDGD